MRKFPGQAGLGVSLSTGAEQGRKMQFYHRLDRDRRPPGQLAHFVYPLALAMLHISNRGNTAKQNF